MGLGRGLAPTRGGPRQRPVGSRLQHPEGEPKLPGVGEADPAEKGQESFRGWAMEQPVLTGSPPTTCNSAGKQAAGEQTPRLPSLHRPLRLMPLPTLVCKV